MGCFCCLMKPDWLRDIQLFLKKMLPWQILHTHWPPAQINSPEKNVTNYKSQQSENPLSCSHLFHRALCVKVYKADTARVCMYTFDIDVAVLVVAQSQCIPLLCVQRCGWLQQIINKLVVNLVKWNPDAELQRFIHGDIAEACSL